MYNIEKTAKVLEARIAKERDFEIVLKNGAEVCIDAISCTTGCYVYFADYGKCKYAKDTLTVAKWLCEYPAIINEIEAAEKAYFEENEPKLIAYFEKNIKGRSRAQHDVGCEIFDLMYHSGKTVSEFASYEEEDAYFLNEYHKVHPEYSAEYLADALKLCDALNTYSDWHKDVYGYRPRNFGLVG